MAGMQPKQSANAQLTCRCGPSVAAVAGEIQMEVIVMVAVGLGAEHGRELAAGAIVHSPQKRLLTRLSAPAAFHRDCLAIAEKKRGDVDGVGVPVLGQPSAVDMIDRPAGIGCHHLQLDQVAAEIVARRGPHRLAHPALDRWDHRTAQHGGRAELHMAVRRRCHLERLQGAARLRTAEGRALEEEVIRRT